MQEFTAELVEGLSLPGVMTVEVGIALLLIGGLQIVAAIELIALLLHEEVHQVLADLRLPEALVALVEVLELLPEVLVEDLPEVAVVEVNNKSIKYLQTLQVQFCKVFL